MGLEIMNFLMSMFILLVVLLHNTSTVNIYVHNIIIIFINWYRLHIFYVKIILKQVSIVVCECVCMCVCEHVRV